MKRLLLFFLPLALWGQIAPVCPPSAVAGSTIPCSAMYSGGLSLSDFQIFLVLPASVGAPTITAGTAALAAQKIATCNGVLCLVYGLNQIIMGIGELLHFTVPIPSNLTGNITIGLGGPLVSDPNANSVTVFVNPPVTVSISPSISKCDVNGDGQTDSLDVAVMRDSALGLGLPHDLNADGKTNVFDLVIVIHAVLGLGCLAL